MIVIDLLWSCDDGTHIVGFYIRHWLTKSISHGWLDLVVYEDQLKNKNLLKASLQHLLVDFATTNQ